MTDNVNAEIIAIGTEILLGEITDTNSVYMAQQMRDVGINLYYMTSVGDNEARIANAIELALGRADVILTCGGLGPTVDDVTRQGIARAVGRDLTFHENLYDQIAARFAMYKVTMTENNRRQAYLPQDAIPIENPVGTAPAFMVEVANKVIVSLPGVPRELKYLMTKRVIPYLLSKYQLGVIKARILKTAGIGESTLDDMLGSALLEGNNPTVGLAAHHGIIDIRITAKADSIAEADVMLETHALRVRERAGHYIFGEGRDKLEPNLLALLAQHDVRLQITEAGIDNAVIDRLSKLPKSDAILEATQCYAHPDELRAQVSEAPDQSLRTLAESVACSIGDDPTKVSIVILSLPDIDESADIDVATVVAVYTNGELQSRVYGFGAASQLSRQWVSRWAMAIVWRMVKEIHSDLA